MIKYNANPKGWKTGDCVIRAISLATGKSWKDVYKDLFDIGMKKCRMLNDPIVYEEYLNKLGWTKHNQPRFMYYMEGHSAFYKKQTVNEFTNDLSFDRKINGSKFNSYIITVANHMTCVKLDESGEYQINDTWDCGEKTVGNYWTKENF